MITTFDRVAKIFREMESESSRTELAALTRRLLFDMEVGDARRLTYLMQGRINPVFESLEIGMGPSLILQAIAMATGDMSNLKVANELYEHNGDVGVVAVLLLKDEGAIYSIEHVFDVFKHIAMASGIGAQGEKVDLLAGLLHGTKLEAKYLCRIPLGKLRLGVSDSTIIESLIESRGWKKVVTDAYNNTSDLGYIVERVREAGPQCLSSVKTVVGKPVQPMLANHVSSAHEAFVKFPEIFAVEPKYDGFRMQIHKKGDDITIFSRSLERMNDSFPDIVKAVREQIAVADCIIDAEACGFVSESEEFLPFQETIKRRRKYDVEATMAEIPLRLFVFDVLSVDGNTTLDLDYMARRRFLDAIIIEGPTVIEAPYTLVSTDHEVQTVYDYWISLGLEGVMLKDIRAPYKAGSRSYAWTKWKRSVAGTLGDTVDCVIVGFVPGQGRRASFGIGALLLAVKNEETGNLETVTKAGTGLSDDQLVEILSKIFPYIGPKSEEVLTKSAAIWVEPKVVVEIQADEITRSPMHTCGSEGGVGYALRFPRVKSFRYDKSVKDITTVSQIVQMYNDQMARMKR